MNIPNDDFKEATASFQKAAQDIQRRFYSEIEAILVRKIEEIEGRVPTDDEVKRFGLKARWPDGRMEYKWKGQTLIVVEPNTDGPKVGWTIHT